MRGSGRRGTGGETTEGERMALFASTRHWYITAAAGAPPSTAAVATSAGTHFAVRVHARTRRARMHQTVFARHCREGPEGLWHRRLSQGRSHQALNPKASHIGSESSGEWKGERLQTGVGIDWMEFSWCCPQLVESCRCIFWVSSSK